MNAFVFDAKLDSFEQDVINASKETPVMVDFWAEWCGPCKQIGPLLEKLALEFNGGFLLAKVDVEKEQQLAGYFQIKSIPTLMLLKDGKIVDGFSAALSEAQLREFLNHHQITVKPQLVEAEAELPVPEAPDPHQEVIRLRHALAEAADDDSLKLELGLALTATQAYAEALALFEGLPANLAMDHRITKARARIDLAERVKDAPAIEVLVTAIAAKPEDFEAHRLLGLQYLVQGRSEAGLAQLLELLRMNRDYQDGLPRKLLIEAFNTVDDEDLVRLYRRKMASLLN
ncbi:thioredoxin [Arenimonas sp.]|jgi:putative thioredoxin|uniref:thioredoxin n=1 Tax=Arenimonas sp. TaxID=1872635 RepID=UPI0037BE78B5